MDACFGGHELLKVENRVGVYSLDLGDLPPVFFIRTNRANRCLILTVFAANRPRGVKR